MPLTDEDKIVRNYRPLLMPATSTVSQAARHMRIRNASAVIVVEGSDELGGIFTERDAIDRVLADGLDPASTLLSEVMTYNPARISPGQTGAEALQLMRQTCCRHLPVVLGNRVVGLISCGDFRKSDERLDGQKTEASRRLTQHDATANNTSAGHPAPTGSVG